MTVLNKTSNISPNEVNDASSNIPLEVTVTEVILLSPKEKQTFDAMTHFETHLFIPYRQTNRNRASSGDIQLRALIA